VDKGNDTPVWGPQALVAGTNGKLLLLDQVNGRIFSLQLDAPEQNSEILRRPGGVKATDLVSVADQLYVWDERPIAVNPADVQAAGDPRALVATSAASHLTVATSTFAQMGSVSSGSSADLLRSVGAAMAPNGAPISETQWIYSPSIGEISAQVHRRTDKHGADVALRGQGQLSLQIDVADQLGILEVLALDREGRPYILVENVSDDANRPSSLSVVRFDVKGSIDKLFLLPGTEASARRFVTVTSAGDVMFLDTTADQVRILKIEPLDISAGSRIGLRFSALVQPLPAEAPAEEVLQALAPRSREQVVASALPFETATWTASPQTYGPDPDHHCQGFSDRVRRPWYIEGHLNGSLVGIPYCWGCKYSIDRFVSAIGNGKLAGNICTKEDPRTDAVGVDCSGFVSETWGLVGHFTTSKIPTISDPIEPLNLRPGDVLNKPGSHVMLFLRFTPSGRVEVIQAATNDCNGHVCRKQYVLTSLLNSGYKLRKARLIVDQ
jgi:hypothetical protein